MYQVTYSSNGSVNTYNTTIPSITITGLVPKTTYTFSVVGYTITGPWTAQQVQTTTAAIRKCIYHLIHYSLQPHTIYVKTYLYLYPHPTANVTGVVVVFTNSTSARVSWLAVQLPPDGLLTGYSVYYRSLPNTSMMQSGGYISQTFPPTTTSGDINNLSPNGMYQFIVVAGVTILGQFYSGEVDLSLAVNTYSISCSPGSIPVQTVTVNNVSDTPPTTSFYRGMLAGTLIGVSSAVLVGALAIALIMVVTCILRKKRCGLATIIVIPPLCITVFQHVLVVGLLFVD